jgi:hypothetical protein
VTVGVKADAATVTSVEVGDPDAVTVGVNVDAATATTPATAVMSI